jgi:hypothetical protein
VRDCDPAVLRDRLARACAERDDALTLLYRVRRLLRTSTGPIDPDDLATALLHGEPDRDSGPCPTCGRTPAAPPRGDPVPTITTRLPRSWFGYSERIGPPVGSAISVQGRPGRVVAVREEGDMLDVDVEVDVVPDALTGVPGTLSVGEQTEGQLPIEEDR